MKKQNRLALAVVTSCLLGGSLLGPFGKVQAAPAAPQVAAQASKVNVNKASASELEGIRGVGPKLAERIVKYREANGRFEQPEDLIRVPGIGQAKFEKLKDQITL